VSSKYEDVLLRLRSPDIHGLEPRAETGQPQQGAHSRLQRGTACSVGSSICVLEPAITVCNLDQRDCEQASAIDTLKLWVGSGSLADGTFGSKNVQGKLHWLSGGFSGIATAAFRLSQLVAAETEVPDDRTPASFMQ
jgi:hypothetical protein